jgi:mono/diheme cytochrome c family protein
MRGTLRATRGWRDLRDTLHAARIREDRMTNRTRWTALVGLLGLVLASAAYAQTPAEAPKAKDGKTIFTDNHCNSCHSIEAAGIVKKKAAEDEAAPAEKTENKPPDLSDVGTKQKAAWFSKFLMKQEKLDGELHPKRFKGTAPELATLTTWLETLKTKPAKK